MALGEEMPLLARHEGVWDGTCKNYNAVGVMVDEPMSRLFCRVSDDPDPPITRPIPVAGPTAAAMFATLRRAIATSASGAAMTLASVRPGKCRRTMKTAPRCSIGSAPRHRGMLCDPRLAQPRPGGVTPAHHSPSPACGRGERRRSRPG